MKAPGLSRVAASAYSERALAYRRQRGLPLAARRAGAYTAEVNPTRSDITDLLHEHVAGPAGVVLPALVAAVEAVRADARGGDARGSR